MSGSLQRALGLWLATKVPALSVFADDLANRQNVYPEGVLMVLSHYVTPIGVGRRSPMTRSEAGAVVTVGRLYQVEDTLRLTIRSPSTSTKAGQQVVDEISDLVEQAVLAEKSRVGQTVLDDTGAAPAVGFPLQTFDVVGKVQLGSAADGEPTLFQSAVTLRLTRLMPVEVPVEAVIENIIVEDADGEE